jgi:hypothetical protein
MLPTPTPDWWPQHLEVVDRTVEIAEIATPLQAFLAKAAAIHFVMFSEPLIVTSGHDAVHGTGSKHYEWKAVDIRSKDLTTEQADLFAQKLVPLQSEFKVGIFDERFVGIQHWHVETA